MSSWDDVYQYSPLWDNIFEIRRNREQVVIALLICNEECHWKIYTRIKCHFTTAFSQKRMKEIDSRMYVSDIQFYGSPKSRAIVGKNN